MIKTNYKKNLIHKKSTSVAGCFHLKQLKKKKIVIQNNGFSPVTRHHERGTGQQSGKWDTRRPSQGLEEFPSDNVGRSSAEPKLAWVEKLKGQESPTCRAESQEKLQHWQNFRALYHTRDFLKSPPEYRSLQARTKTVAWHPKPQRNHPEKAGWTIPIAYGQQQHTLQRY